MPDRSHIQSNGRWRLAGEGDTATPANQISRCDMLARMARPHPAHTQ